MRPCVAALVTALLFLLPGVRATDELPRYLTGGLVPLPEPVQTRLDEHRDSVRLGINTDWLLTAGIAPKPFVEAVATLAQGASDGAFPGAVLYVNSAMGEMMPVGIGDMMTDPERHQADWSTLYEIGSLTGPVAVLPQVLHEIDAGRIHLDDALGKYVPVFRNSEKGAITIEMLLRHTSGLPAAASIPAGVTSHNAVLKHLVDLPLVAAPGTKAQPSGLNFTFLGLILESLSGKPALDSAMADLFEPLGMVNTATVLPAQWRHRCAPGPYSQWHGRMAWGEAADPIAFALAQSGGNGGLITSADDLGLFSKAMMHYWNAGTADGITTQTLRLSATRAENAEGSPIGLGWQLGGLGEGSFGWNADTGSCLWIDPQRALYVVILMNADHPGAVSARAIEVREKALHWVRMAVTPPKGPQASVPAAHSEERGIWTS